MVNFNGDVVFVDTSGQIRTVSGDITIRADDTGIRSVIIGSGARLRPDTDLRMDLGASFARWHQLNAGRTYSVSGFWGVDRNTPYMEVLRDFDFDFQELICSGLGIGFIDCGFVLSGDISLFDDDAATTIFRNLVQFDERPFINTHSDAGFSPAATIAEIDMVRPVDSRDVSGFIIVGVDNLYRLGGHTRRFSEIFGISGVFNTIAPRTSGTYIRVDGALVPSTSGAYNLGSGTLPWQTIFANSGCFTLRPSVNGSGVLLEGEVTSGEGLSQAQVLARTLGA